MFYVVDMLKAYLLKGVTCPAMLFRTIKLVNPEIFIPEVCIPDPV
jgi:hypothetical protein